MKVYLINYELYGSQETLYYLNQNIDILTVKKETDKVIFFEENSLERVKANKEDLEKLKIVNYEIDKLRIQLLTTDKEDGIKRIKDEMKALIERYYRSFSTIVNEARANGIEPDISIKGLI